MRRTVIIAAFAVFLFGCEPQTKKTGSITLLQGFEKVCSGKVYLKTFTIAMYGTGFGCSKTRRDRKMIADVSRFSKKHRVLKQRNIYDHGFLRVVELTVCDEKAVP